MLSVHIGGGVMYSKSKRFFSGGLKNISATLLANQHNNGVVEVYEEEEILWSEPFKGQEGQDSKA